jgi:hypothetical protein
MDTDELLFEVERLQRVNAALLADCGVHMPTSAVIFVISCSVVLLLLLGWYCAGVWIDAKENKK